MQVCYVISRCAVGRAEQGLSGSLLWGSPLAPPPGQVGPGLWTGVPTSLVEFLKDTPMSRVVLPSHCFKFHCRL